MNDMSVQPESTRPDFPKMEEEIAAFWEKKRIFERSVEERPENKGYAFYDGPPFATGLPHYGHLLQSTLKDAVPRYWTMQGYRVPRRWGWDCHGLPLENMVEKELNLGSKRDIEAFGIDKFNEACRNSVLTYEKEWDRYIKRLGRWVDFEHSYKTMDDSYIESVWWVFAELHRKGLIYKDQRVSFYCPRCATPLSNFEIAMDNSYEDRDDPAITVKFKVVDEPNTYLLAWTTTPWTLPANVALAVHPELTYVKAKLSSGEMIICAETRLSSVLSSDHDGHDHSPTYEIISQYKGVELEGLRYEPLYTYLPTSDKAYRVVTMGYVSAEDGTGIVHTAPAFGEEDFLASKAHDLPVLMTVDDEGRQMVEVVVAPGLPIKESDSKIIEDLRARGLLFHEDGITHSVAVCWRCSTPLLYRAQPAWFVDVTTLKPKLLETAKKINWHPGHFKEGRFGKGLESAPDWCISRTRYWGAPLPVWECESCKAQKIFGSLKELKEAKPDGLSTDLHRPSIDQVTISCACGGRMKRISEVFDCWFESGSMPYGSGHYPFENKDWFDANFPADFIAEAQDQTRGWFYSLHVLSTALFNKPAFKNVIVTGMVLAEDGKKMSKKLKNYPDPWELMTTMGSDAIRYYLLSSPVVRAEQLNFSQKECLMLQRTLLGTLWNVRTFYRTYAGAEKIEITKPRSMHVLDRWICAKLMKLEKEVTEAMNGYDMAEATRLLRPFVEDLSTWWLRRSRERIKGEDAYDRVDALRTLREVLMELSLLMAPFTPFFADKLYQDVEGPKMSVHLDMWPKADERMIDEGLLKDMEWVREVVTKGLEARVTSKIPVRQALALLTVRLKDAGEASRLQAKSEYLALIRDELNVEKVAIDSGSEGIQEGEMFAVFLDTVITPELKKKGMLRELVRQIMNLRKDMNLTPIDTIEIAIAVADPGLRDTLEGFQSQLAKQTKANHVSIGESLDGQASPVEIDGNTLRVVIKKA